MRRLLVAAALLGLACEKGAALRSQLREEQNAFRRSQARAPLRLDDSLTRKVIADCIKADIQNIRVQPSSDSAAAVSFTWKDADKELRGGADLQRTAAIWTAVKVWQETPDGPSPLCE